VESRLNAMQGPPAEAPSAGNRPAPAIAAGDAAETGSANDNGSGWPDEATESAMRAEIRGRGESPAAQGPSSDPPVEKDLPALATLVNRIPPATRSALDELFRAKFTRVKRIPERDLQ
jgi:hypothetical protein